MKCLIVDQMHESLLPMMAEIGVQADYQPQITPEEVFQIIASYDGIMVRSKMNLDQLFFKKATSLKFVARAGAGMDKIDVEAYYMLRKAIPMHLQNKRWRCYYH